MATLRKMNAGEFARRLRADRDIPDKRFALFLGAGCSISSGVPGAASLVKDRWLPRLQGLCDLDGKNIDAWIKEEFPDYDHKNPASCYGSVMGRVFLNPEDRQQEIENLCDGKFPGFGYAVLAKLITREGGKFNVVVTTNFDDLVSDALYLFTTTRPLVIGHESLAGFIRPTRTRPLVVKLHGDAHLAPQNTAAETANIQEEVERQVKFLLNDRGLIILGYGGNDKGIASMLSTLPREALPFGIFWISGSEPKCQLRPWLEERNAVWVDMFDFDEMMLLIRDTFDLAHPDPKPFDAIFQNYTDTYKKLSERIRSVPVKAEDKALKSALERADKEFTNWWSVEVEASKLKKTDSKKADEIYSKGIEQYSDSAPLLGNYALFLETIRKDYDKAEQFFQRALVADPNYANNLGNYAIFLKKVRKDYDKAEQFYQRALAADPNDVHYLGNYANFLYEIRKNYDQAEQYYQHSFEVDPNHANTLGNYALFLETIRKNYDQAEQFYQRALSAEPNHANTLGNYAIFLYQIHKDYDQAEQFFQRALAADPNDDYSSLGKYAIFLLKIRKNYDQAEQLFQRALSANPNDANTLGNYAFFLENIRKDYDQAEQFYQRAFAADILDANTLGKYALFLETIRKDYDKAEQFYQRAFAANPNSANTLSNYAGLLLSLGKNDQGYPLLDKAISLLPDPNSPGLAAELWFYAFCHWSMEKQNEALKNLRKILLDGERSPDRNLSANVERARQDGHTDIKWIEILADVITKGEDIKKLDGWPDWKIT